METKNRARKATGFETLQARDCWDNHACSHRILAQSKNILNRLKEHEEGALETRKNFRGKELKHDNRQSKPQNAKYFHILVFLRVGLCCPTEQHFD